MLKYNVKKMKLYKKLLQLSTHHPGGVCFFPQVYVAGNGRPAGSPIPSVSYTDFVFFDPDNSGTVRNTQHRKISPPADTPPTTIATIPDKRYG